MTTDAQTLVGVIEGIDIKDGQKKDGSDWRRFAFKIRSPAGTRTYSTFDKGWPTNLLGGKTYSFTFIEKQGDKGMLYDLTGARQVDPSEFGAQPSSNGEFKQPYEAPTDEAKARVSTEPQPQFKSPSRSYDQNRDIERRSIERQVALKAAVDCFNGHTEISVFSPRGEFNVIEYADRFFAWLREPPADVRSSPAEPVSEGEPPYEWAALTTGGPLLFNDEGKAEIKPQGEPESDGEPALFPPEQASKSPEAKAPRFYSLDALIKFCEEKYGINEAGMVEIIGKPLSEGGKFSEMHATIAHHFAEQGEQIKDTE